MTSLEQMRKERLERSEKLLEQAGCAKCAICQVWMDKDLIKGRVCLKCREKENEN